MIVEETDADIFSSKAQTLVCPVNTVGAMGAGLAFAFKNKFPGLEKRYKQACDQGVFKRSGFLIYTHGKGASERKVLCMATKHHWKHPSKLQWIDQALFHIACDWHLCKITSLAIPAVGCGLGGLFWEDVKELVYRHLDPIELPVMIHRPQNFITSDR